MNETDSRLILPDMTNPYLNQAFEEILLNSLHKKKYNFILRFWRSEPSVIIGRNQSIKVEVNIKACKRYEIPIIRRISGGGAVYLDLGSLNFSFFLNHNSTFFSKNVSILNKFLIQIIIDALKKSNLDCIYNPPNSIFLDGKKISGNAQIYRGNSVLHHGTLLVNSDLKIQAMVLNTDINAKCERCIPSNRTETTNLCFVNRNITMNEILQNVVREVERVFNLKLHNLNLTEQELNLAILRIKDRYLNLNWQNRIL